MPTNHDPAVSKSKDQTSRQDFVLVRPQRKFSPEAAA
jgi:hypothetical protein